MRHYQARQDDRLKHLDIEILQKLNLKKKFFFQVREN